METHGSELPGARKHLTVFLLKFRKAHRHPVQNGARGKPVKSRISILQGIWGGQETISFPEQKQNFPTDCANQRIWGENWMLPMLKPEAVGLVFTPFYLGKSPIEVLYPPWAAYIKAVARQPPGQSLPHPITLSGLTAVWYQRPQAGVNQVLFLSSATQEKPQRKKLVQVKPKQKRLCFCQWTPGTSQVHHQ